jgi:glycosyltransferase involved in cell wall biosynthesis
VKILLIHQNFPGQFRGLAPALQAAGHDLRAVSARSEKVLAGVPNTQYVGSQSTTASIHPWLMTTETSVIRGEAVAAVVQHMVHDGWTPDVVLGHTGWGEMLFMRQVLPHARLLGFNELYYQTEGGNVGFDPEFPADPLASQRLTVRNMHLMSSLLACDVGITPTHWQASCFPPLLRQKLAVVHDGILTDQLQPDPTAWVNLNRDGLRLSHGDEVVTFINRNLEPMRGYHQFMRALPQILKQRPNARVVIVGGDGVSYGSPAPDGTTYKQIYLNEVRDQLDMSRVHFVSRVPYKVLLSLLRISAAHVYLTMPFVLSWSLLEAMSVGALVIGSDTAPVREVIEHNQNGLLVNYFDPKQLADAVCDVLANPQTYAHLRAAARQTVVDRYDFATKSLPVYLDLIHAVNT